MTNIPEVEFGIVEVSPDYFLIELFKRRRINTVFEVTKSEDITITINYTIFFTNTISE